MNAFQLALSNLLHPAPRPPKKNQDGTKTCTECGANFWPNSSNDLVCGDACRKARVQKRGFARRGGPKRKQGEKK